MTRLNRLHLGLCLVCTCATLQAQTGWERIQQQQLSDALSKVRAPGAESTNALEHYVQIIEDAKAAEAVPDLEVLEPKVQTPDLQLKIAATLVRMGDAKPQYWQAVLTAATEAADSDMPFPYTEADQLEPYFKQMDWRSPETRTKVARATAFYPKAVAHLGETADPRGDAVLRRAAASPNILVMLAAAAGLAELKDEAAVPLLLQADTRLSPPMKGLLATTLLYFHDARAQAYVKQWMPHGQDLAQHLRMKPTPYSPAYFGPPFTAH